MDAQFWLQRWENNQIGFHKEEANPALVDNLDKLSLAKESRIFLPLCGKTLDFGWLLAQGYRAAGSELSESAIVQLFEELGVKPTISSIGALKRYSAQNIDIFVGDIFHLSGETLGPVDATYDRAALIALPPAMREQYAAHLMNITRKAPQLLLSFTYEPGIIEGPPFSVSDEEVARHYDKHYALTLAVKKVIPNYLHEKYPATENVWLLEKKVTSTVNY
jgi:thiopurine S-methyltransferase